METTFLKRPGYPDLAYNHLPATRPGRPGVLFCGGFRSDRKGTKATHLEGFCQDRGMAYTRFDYSGHGDSGGRFADGTIESWRDDALAVLDTLTGGPLVVVGSSMGGWIGLHLALLRPGRVRGFVGIAAAPDFTRDMPKHFDDAMMRSYRENGYAEVPNGYDPRPYLITRALIESGNRVCLLDSTHDLPIPVHLLQGGCDTEVDPSTPERIRACLTGAFVTVTMVNDGDHSLSRPQDLALIEQAISGVCT